MEQLSLDGFTVDDAGNVAAETIAVTYRTREYILKTTTNYTADGTEDIIAYTALAAARTVTLPLAADAPEGTELEIRDWSNSAGTNNINVAATSPDTLVGPSAVSTNGGSLRVVSNGVDKWYSCK